MPTAITDKLVASVVEVIDLSELFPASVLKGRIALDVRLERGTLSLGKCARLSGPSFEEDVEFLGIEMLSDPRDPNVVRVHCSKPMGGVLPAGKVEGWSIVEE